MFKRTSLFTLYPHAPQQCTGIHGSTGLELYYSTSYSNLTAPPFWRRQKPWNAQAADWYFCQVEFVHGFVNRDFAKQMEAGTFQNFKPRSQKAAPSCRKTSCHATFELSEKNGIYLKEVWLVLIRCTWINSRDPGIASVADKCLVLFSATAVQKKGDFQKGQWWINNFLPFFLVTLHCTRSWGRAPQYLKTMVWTNCHQRFPGDPKHHITIPGEPPKKNQLSFRV